MPLDVASWQSGAGLAGVLKATFQRYPDIELELKALILRKVKGESKKTPRFFFRSVDIHAVFIKILEGKGHSETEWPFNTKYLGLKTLSSFVSAVREENYERAVQHTGDRAAIAHIPVGTGYTSLTKPRGLMQAVEIDSLALDVIFVLVLKHENGLETIHVMKKLHLLLAVESLSGCALWYYVVHGDDATAEDVVALIRQMLSAKLPQPEFVIGDLELYSGAGFPAEAMPEMAQAQPTVLRLDNALAHLSNKISMEVRKQTGCIIDYGVPGRPERRPNVERTFKNFVQDLLQRFPNTTGAGPDKGRVADPEEAACKFRITPDLLDEMAYKYFANFNAMPSEGLYGLSPLEAVGQLLRTDTYIPRLPPFDLRKSLGMVTVKIARTVKGGAKEKHRPYVTIERARYTSRTLLEDPALVGKKLIIHVNEADIRFVEAFLENGSPIGPLKAQGDWGDHPHSMMTRKKANSLISRRIIVRVKGKSILICYKEHMIKELKAADERNKKDAKSAAELDRLNTEASRLGSSGIHSAKSYVPCAPATLPSPSAKTEPERERDFLLPPESLDLSFMLELTKKL